MASNTPCFQPKPSSPPIPSGSANAAIRAATTPTRTTTIPICLPDTVAGRSYSSNPLDGRLSDTRPQHHRTAETTELAESNETAPAGPGCAPPPGRPIVRVWRGRHGT
jgi:hypothetical protein